MLYIVEVPHQRAPKCWSVNSRDMLVSVANELATRSGEMFDTFEDAAEWLAHDLHAFSIYETAEEALAALEHGDLVFSGHGGGKARDALVAQLQKCGEWPEAKDKKAMAEFEIYFLNNGAALFQTEEFCHYYDDMGQMAADFVEYQQDGHTNGWDGHEAESRMKYDADQERNGGYLCIMENTWEDLDPEWGYNTDNFLRHLEQLEFQPA